MRKFRLLVLCSLFTLIALAGTHAQVADPTAAAQAPVPSSGHDYIGMASETVSPANGMPSFELPIRTSAGRGLSFPFGIRYSGAEPAYISSGGTFGLYWVNNAAGVPNEYGGWSYELPAYTAHARVINAYPDPSGTGTDLCDGTDSYVFLGFDGIQQTPQIVNGWPDSTNRYPSACNTVGAGTGSQPPLDLADRDGKVHFHFNQGPYEGGWSDPSTVGTWGMLAQTITDRNGNQITLNCPNSCQYSGYSSLSSPVLPAGSYTDTAGRTVVAWTGIAGTSGDQLAVSGLSSNITVHWANFTTSLPTKSYPVAGFTSCSIGGGSATVRNITDIDLPNGTKYTFTYGGPWGRLTKITFPTGGYVRYVWGTNQNSAYVYGFYYDSQGLQHSCYVTYDTAAITDRYVSYDGVNEVLHQQFSYATSWSTTPGPGTNISRVTIVTSTDFLTGLVAKVTYTYWPTSIPPFLEKQILYQDGSGNTLKTVNKSWKDRYSTVGEQTILANGQATTVLKCNDASDQVLGTYEYGFASEGSKPADPSCAVNPSGGTTLSYGMDTSVMGPLKRQTSTVYHNYSSTGVTMLFDPDSTTTYDGAGNQIAKTTYTYDVNAVTPSGATTGLVSPPGGRGNMSSISRWLNTSNSYLTTSYAYYDTGQLYTVTDGCGNTNCADMPASSTYMGCNGTSVSTHTTTYCYSDSYASGTGTPPGQTNAYLTKVTRPNTGAAHVQTFTWGYSDGLLRSSTDENSRMTTYQYGDSLLRLTQVDGPDGSETKYAYSDTTPNPSVTTCKLINGTAGATCSATAPPAGWMVSKRVADGLGHSVQAQLASDPDGASYTDTTYDGFGHVWKKKNPYRSAASPTDGTTVYSYDVLGQTLSVSEPDGSLVTTSYSGPCTTVTDESGRIHSSCTDSLGRLAQVNEPGTGSTVGTPGTGSVTISGSEQSHAATPGSATVGLNYNGASCLSNGHGGYYPQSGYIYVTVHGIQSTTSWGGSCDTGGGFTLQPTMNQIAINLASSISGSGAGVTASAGGTSISITATTSGSATNYAMSYNWSSTGSGGISPSGPSAMSGGSNAATDSGTVSISVNGYLVSQNYASSDTSQTVASGLATQLNSSSSPVSASLSGSTITLTSRVTGAASNYSLSASSTWNTQYFSTASFSGSPSGSTLTGGSDGSLGTNPLVTLYSYDALDNLICAVQKGTDTTAFTTCGAAPALWRPRSFVYDSLSRLTSATNPESGTISYTYDANSNVATKVAPIPNKIPADTSSPQTVTTTYSYDVLNRLTTKTYSNGTATARYGYDGNSLTGCTYTVPTLSDSNPIGRRTAMCDGSGATHWALDITPSVGWKTTEARNIAGITNTTTAQNNFGGMLYQLMYPTGRTVTYGASGAGRYLSAIDSANGINYAQNATYAPFGGLLTMINGSAPITTTNAYNERLQPVTLSAATAANTLISRSYDFHRGNGDNGNVYQIVNNVDNSRNQSFTYDALNRIATAQSQAISGSECWGESFSIDNWSNLTNKTVTKCSAETLNAPATTKNQVSGYCYDLAGNLLGTSGCPSLPYTPSYTYDAENRLITGGGCTFAYDGDGNRVRKTGCANIYYWLDNGGNTLDEAPNGTLVREYVFFNGKRLARRDVSTNTVHYFFADHLGSMSVVANASGTLPVESDSDYYPYGGEIVVTAPTIQDQNYKFTAKERDSQTGFDNFGARYYASAQGRFISPDPTPDGVAPADPQSWNLYSYTRNRPTRSVDIGGHWATDVHAEIVTAALQGYVSAGELKQLVAEQYVMDKNQDPEFQYRHAMSNGQSTPPQSAQEASEKMWDFVATMAAGAHATLGSDGQFNSVSLAYLGDAIHTLEDYTSPMHTSSSGQPLPWYGAAHGGFKHWQGENSPSDSWAGFGLAIRLTMAAFMDVNPVLAAKKGLTAATFDAQANQRISDYVERFFRMSGNVMSSNNVAEEAARQCALGNPAACSHQRCPGQDSGSACFSGGNGPHMFGD